MVGGAVGVRCVDDKWLTWLTGKVGAELCSGPEVGSGPPVVTSY